MDGSYLRRDGDVKWGAFLQSLNTCFIRISPEELHNLIESFNSFVNLWHLYVNQIMCDFLIRSNIKLQTLQIVDGFYTATSKCPDIFYAASLRNLEKLSLTRETRGQFNEIDEWVIFAIVYNLQSLQVLDLEMGSNLSWCRHFAGLVNLKILWWRAILLGFDDLTFEDIAGDIIVPQELKADGNFKVQYSFALAFAGFVENSRVLVQPETSTTGIKLSVES